MHGVDFKFTVGGGAWTLEQRQFYEENGFLVISRLVSHDLLDEFKDHFIKLCNGEREKGQLTMMKDVSLMKQGVVQGERLVNKIQDFIHDDCLSRYCFLPQVLDNVESVIGPNIKAMHTMLINKPPDSGQMTSRHPMHQDLHYFPFRPADGIVASWTAMEPVHKENGCLFVVPGTHKGTLLQHDYPEWEGGVNKFYHGVRGFHDTNHTYVEMEKGDTVFFHPLLLHGSGSNTTNGFRKAISCHYASTKCHYIDVSGTSQENIAKEVEEMAKRRGVQISFQDVWRFRSRLARGIEAHL